MNVVLADGRRLVDLDDDDVKPAFRRDGFVVLRGFAPTAPDVDAFTRRFTETYFYGYGRGAFPGLPAITFANESKLALAPHCDNGLRPEDQRPEITWFWCQTPAADAGETTFFDGIRVWAALAPATRELLTARRVRFLTRYAWRDMGLSDAAALEAFAARNGARVVAVHDDGAADVEVLTSAVRRPRWSDELAFVSSLCLAGTPGFQAMRITLEDAPELPAGLREEIAAALEACGELLAWQAGDVVFLDNTRFLHGRRGYTDEQRRVYLIQTLRASF